MAYGDKVVLSRSEFVKILAERSDAPSDISGIMRYVESVFMLQGEDDRPAYIFEVDFDKLDLDGFVELDEGLKLMQVAAVLVPKRSISYLGEVTPKSLGIKGRIDAIREKIKELCGFVARYGGDEDER